MLKKKKGEKKWRNASGTMTISGSSIWDVDKFIIESKDR